MTEWLSSTGGPLICTEARLAASWRGIDGLSVPHDKATSDYERGGLASYTYTGLARLEDGSFALVLGDAAVDTIVRSIGGRTFMLRAMACEPDFDGDAFLKGLDPFLLANPDQTIEWQFSSSPLILFDSSSPGDEVGESCVFDMTPGTYRVLTRYLEKDDDYILIIHRFEPV